MPKSINGRRTKPPTVPSAHSSKRYEKRSRKNKRKTTTLLYSPKRRMQCHSGWDREQSKRSGNARAILNVKKQIPGRKRLEARETPRWAGSADQAETRVTQTHRESRDGINTSRRALDSHDSHLTSPCCHSSPTQPTVAYCRAG
jgi:hypothetical protein